MEEQHSLLRVTPGILGAMTPPGKSPRAPSAWADGFVSPSQPWLGTEHMEELCIGEVSAKGNAGPCCAEQLLQVADAEAAARVCGRRGTRGWHRKNTCLE